MKLNIALVEPFYSGSHKRWADSLIKYSSHRIQLFSLPGRHWKWRMYGGAITLATQINQSGDTFDALLATDMLDVATFRALLLPQYRNLPMGVYFHENQLAYPWSATDVDPELQRDRHYMFINYTTALTADAVYFNSQYNLRSFTDGLKPFLAAFPDFQNIFSLDSIFRKCRVLYLGNDYPALPLAAGTNRYQDAVVLWNHRWEYDKNPELFFKTLFRLSEEHIDFRLIVAGTHGNKIPPIFKEAKTKLTKHILHFGMLENYTDYIDLVQQSNILPVTAHQDFFGQSVVEAIYCGCIPLLPNRLAYPEHLSPVEFPENFYQTETGFYEKLKQIIQAPEQFANNYRQYVARYNWHQLISKYDACFEELANAKH